MRIVLDNNVPVGVASFLTGHHVSTSPELGWERLKNGSLLFAAEDAGFDLMITADQNIKWQQNLTKRKLALLVLGSNYLARGTEVRSHYRREGRRREAR